MPSPLTSKQKEMGQWDGVWLQAREWETEEQRQRRIGVRGGGVGRGGGSLSAMPPSPTHEAHVERDVGDSRTIKEDYAYWESLPDVDEQVRLACSSYPPLRLPRR